MKRTVFYKIELEGSLDLSDQSVVEACIEVIGFDEWDDGEFSAEWELFAVAPRRKDWDDDATFAEVVADFNKWDGVNLKDHISRKECERIEERMYRWLADEQAECELERRLSARGDD